MERVTVFSYKVINESTRKTYSDPVVNGVSHSNMRLYATNEQALIAAKKDSELSSVSIVIIEQLATLPDNQIKKLPEGLPWSSEINSQLIHLQNISETKHPIERVGRVFTR